MKDSLFDASALINIMIDKGSKALKQLSGQSILDLTIYEVGNSIWRLVCLEKKISSKEACSLLDSFLLLRKHMKVLTISEMEKGVKELSIEKGLTFYDASYSIVAQTRDLVLVTDDRVLAKIASKYTKVIQSNNL